MPNYADRSTHYQLPIEDRAAVLSNPAYRAGFVDGVLESPPTPENYEEFPQLYDYLLGHKDASEALRDGSYDPALLAAGYGWMEEEEAHRLSLARERVRAVTTPSRPRAD